MSQYQSFFINAFGDSSQCEEPRAIFDKLKKIRLKLAKSKNLKAAYLVCKDEHLAAMINKPGITEEEIKKLPNSGNIMLKEFAHFLYEEYQKILIENNQASLPVTASKTKEESSEAGTIPF